MQNVIACSTKIIWTPIKANYFARHISAQILTIENLFECNCHRKLFADAQIQTGLLFVFNSQRQQFADAQPKQNHFIGKIRMLLRPNHKRSFPLQIATCKSTLHYLEEAINSNVAKVKLCAIMHY